MARVFTPAMISEITKRAQEGLSSQTIAEELGLNVCSLRVKCSQLGISLRKFRAERISGTAQAPAESSAPRIELTRKPIELVENAGGSRPRGSKSSRPELEQPSATGAEPLIVVVSRLALHRLRHFGAAKGVTAEALAARLLTVIANDGLWKAILDDDAA